MYVNDSHWRILNFRDGTLPSKEKLQLGFINLVKKYKKVLQSADPTTRENMDFIKRLEVTTCKPSSKSTPLSVDMTSVDSSDVPTCKPSFTC